MKSVSPADCCGLLCIFLLSVLGTLAAEQSSAVPAPSTDNKPQCVFLLATPAADSAALIATARRQIALWRGDLKTPTKVEPTRAAMANLAINLLIRSNRWEAVGQERSALALRRFVKSALADVDWRLQSLSGEGDVGALEARLAWLRSATPLDSVAICEVAGIGASHGGAEASYRRSFCVSDPAQILSYMQHAAALGHPAAMEGMGRLCLQGAHPDSCTLRELCRAAQSGRSGAASAVGWRLTIPGSTGDLTAGRQWLQYAAERADVAAMNNLGELIERVQPDAAGRLQARDWYRRAATAGLPEAMINSARLLAQGNAGDCAEAKRWLRQAVTSGLPQAQAWLAGLTCH